MSAGGGRFIGRSQLVSEGTELQTTNRVSGARSAGVRIPIREACAEPAVKRIARH